MHKVKYHTGVVGDLKKITLAQKKIIKQAIETKLVSDPQFFGKPLQFSLKGCRSMRVGDYRVVFQLEGKEVFIVLIEHRSKVYKVANKRT